MDTSFWHSRVLRWLDKRIPARRKYQLDMSNIFIFPSKFGLLFTLLCAALFLLGSNYNNNLMLLLCFFLVSIFLINLSASYSNFAKIKVQVGRISPIFAEEEATIPLWFSHSGEQEDRIPYAGKIYIKPYGDKNHTHIDPQHHTNPATIFLSKLPRGLHTLPRITLESYYPLGLYRCWTHLQFHGEILVYPKPIPCSLNTILGDDSDEQTELQSNDSGIEDFDTLGVYQLGEPMHRIAWKQVAKGQGLVSKRFSGTSSQSIWLSLGNTSATDTEQALGQLAWSVLECNKQNLRYGLNLGSTQVQPSTGITHMDECLKALALYNNSAHQIPQG